MCEHGETQIKWKLEAINSGACHAQSNDVRSTAGKV